MQMNLYLLRNGAPPPEDATNGRAARTKVPKLQPALSNERFCLSAHSFMTSKRSEET